MDIVYKWRDNFIKEARSLAKCAHLSGVVGVKDFFEENNTAYIILEYLEGKTLKEYVREQPGGKVTLSWLLPALEPVMTSLDAVHKEGLVHRDISPDNLMLLPDGKMKLLDFGAARDYTESGEKSLSVLLKPGYAPEEQYRSKGKQGPWSDVYALAGTIYKCITGITPPESMERMRQDEMQRPSALGVEILPQQEQALLHAMEVFAENRYQSVAEFHRDLYGTAMAQQTPVMAETAVTAKNTQMANTVRPQQPEGASSAGLGVQTWFQKNKTAVVAGIAGLAVVSVAAIAALGGRTEPAVEEQQVNVAQSQPEIENEETALPDTSERDERLSTLPDSVYEKISPEAAADFFNSMLPWNVTAELMSCEKTEFGTQIRYKASNTDAIAIYDIDSEQHMGENYYHPDYEYLYADSGWNQYGSDYPVVYFVNGVPENNEEIYNKIYEYSIGGSYLETDYIEGDSCVLTDVETGEVFTISLTDNVDKFGIDPNMVEDIAANLDPYTFLNYQSGISNFNFSYPAYLYNTVQYSEEPTVTPYGTNIQNICFKGTNGSELIFRISQRAESSSFEEMTNYVYNTEAGRLSEAAALQNTAETDYGKVILTGYDSTYTRVEYNLTRIDATYVYQMIVVFPDYVSEKDKLQKDYLTECLYRMCGFSGSSKAVQSFEDYRAYWEEHLYD